MHFVGVFGKQTKNKIGIYFAIAYAWALALHLFEFQTILKRKVGQKFGFRYFQCLGNFMLL
jgi:hypothetical protein